MYTVNKVQFYSFEVIIKITLISQNHKEEVKEVLLKKYQF